MHCRKGCGACCIAPSINEPFYGMPQGKPAGVACVHLDLPTANCKIWNSQDYPETCKKFSPDPQFCGESKAEAVTILTLLEQQTLP